MNNPINHKKRYTADDKQKLKEIASKFKSKEEMYENLSDIAKEFGRTEAGIANQIEEINGWYWAAKK